MEFVPLVCLSLVTWSGITSADGPTVVQQVEEDGDAVLSCSFGENIKGKIFDWTKDVNTEVFFHGNDGTLRPGPSFKGRVSHFPDALQSGNASIVIRGTKVSDSGIYTCDFPNDRPERRSTIFLIVVKILKDRSDEKIPGAAREPVITTLGLTERGVLLQCKVLGASPKPDVKWQDSDGTVLQAEEPQVKEHKSGKYDVILNVIVTKSDNFSCISIQEDISHKIRAQTFVPPVVAAPRPVITTLDLTERGVLLQCEVLGAFTKPDVKWQDSDGTVLQAEEPQVTQRDGKYDVILNITVTKSDTFSCNSTQEDIHHRAQTFVYPFGEAPEQTGPKSNQSNTVEAGLVGAVFAVIAVAMAIVIIKWRRNQQNQRRGNINDNGLPREQYSLTGAVTSD